MLSALSWVNRDHVLSIPTRLRITEEEAKKIIDEHSHFVSSSNLDLIRHSMSSEDDYSNSESESKFVSTSDVTTCSMDSSDADITKKYNLDEYPEDSMGLLSLPDENGNPVQTGITFY